MTRERSTKGLMVAAFAALLVLGGAPLARHRRFEMPVVLGPGVTRVARLSDFCRPLKGTMGDTAVYVLEGRESGGKAVIMSGTHANEPAGLLADLIIVENAVVDKGTLFVIPSFNNSASRNTRPGDGYPLYYDIPTDWGVKTFRMGNRDASPLDQWPDPDVYIHYPEKQLLSYIDARNSNRTWPGRPDGPLMERVTFAAMELMRLEKIDVAVDLHGAETMFPVTNCIVAPERSLKIATLASLTVKATEGFDSHVEPSPPGFRGLSHREIGDHSRRRHSCSRPPSPSSISPPGRRRSSSCSTARTRSFSAWPERRSSSSLTTHPDGPWTSASASICPSPWRSCGNSPRERPAGRSSSGAFPATPTS
jgi:predicted deacylase